MTQRQRNVPIRENDSPQGVALRVIPGNPQAKRAPVGPLPLSPLQRAHAALVADLAKLAPAIPVLPTIPEADDVEALGGHLTAFAQAADKYIAAIGRELHGAVLGVDVGQFTDVVSTAVCGNATFEIAKAVEAVKDGTDIRTGMWGV